MTQVAATLAKWQTLKKALSSFVVEITESAILSSLEPNPISGYYNDELPRVRKAILRARDGKFAHFRYPVKRNAFLIGCLEYTTPGRRNTYSLATVSATVRNESRKSLSGDWREPHRPTFRGYSFAVVPSVWVGWFTIVNPSEEFRR